MDILAVHELDTRDAVYDDQDHIGAFVHLKGFEFLVDCHYGVMAVLDEEAVLHLDLAWTEGYFLF